MTDIKTNKDVIKLRCYSSIFSSTSFTRLLKIDDYSFIDSTIERFDKKKIGTKINNYNDYIKYIYSKLKMQYRNEYIYKNVLINELLLKEYGVKDTLLINEFKAGNSIVDTALFNGSSKAFEIKTELDSDKRLNRQLEDYKKIFNQCYIVTHESLAKKYLKTDNKIGIIVLSNTKSSIKIKEVRPAKFNNNIDSNILIHALRTNEYKNIVKRYYKTLPEMNCFNMFEICKKMLKHIPAATLNDLFITEIHNRKSSTEIMPLINKELRQLCLSMNLNEKAYQNLQNKLNKPIQI